MRSIHFDVSIKLFIVGLLFLTTFSLSAQDSTLVKPEPIRVSLVQFLTDMDQINNFLSEMDQDLFVNSLDVLISDWKESEPSLDSIQIDLDYRLENSVRYRELLNIKRNIGFLEIKLVDIKERYSVKQDDYEAALINIHKYDTVVNLYKEKRDSLQKNDRELLRVTTKRLRSSERKLEKVLMQFVRFQSQLNRRIWKLKITKLAANNRMSNIFSNFKKDTTETLSTIGVKDRTDPKVLLSHNFVIKKEIGWKN